MSDENGPSDNQTSEGPSKIIVLDDSELDQEYFGENFDEERHHAGSESGSRAEGTDRESSSSILNIEVS